MLGLLLLLRVLVVSWDGAHPAIVQELLAQGRLPVLQALVDAGGRWHDLQFTDQLPLPTVTKPGHAQMMTGNPWWVTGVRDNKDWQIIPEGMTLPEQWHASGARVGWVIQKGHLAEAPNGPGPFWRVWQLPGVCALNKGKGGPLAAARGGLECLARFGDAPFFLFVHSKQPDTAGHALGVASTKYRDMLVENDRALGNLLAALPSDTQVVITTDHGFGDDGQGGCPTDQGERHRICPQVWAVTLPALPLGGSRLLDLAPALRP